MFRYVVAAAIAASLVQAADAQSKKIISHPAYQALQAYLAALPKGRPGVFLISEDGKRWGSYICGAEGCTLGSMAALAAAQCVDATQTCDLLAFGYKVVMPFDVAE